ncbi:MAG: choice-of-anchor J domain-containing protein [Thermoplasmatales archaeon]|nr:choice-of-anchor J domain-containing protein [Thermoplasmatales archaeon]
MKGKRIVISVCVVLVLLMSSITIPYTGAEAPKITKDEKVKQPIRMKFDFIRPQLNQVMLAGETYASIGMGLPTIGNAGEPEIPVKPVNVLLPYGAELKEIKVIAGEPILIGKAEIVPKQRPVPIGSDEIPEIEKDEEIYKSSEVYPGYLYKEVTTQYFRGFPIVTINLYPLQWNPSTQELYLYPNMELVVELKDGQVNELFRGTEIDRQEVIKMVDNPREVLTYPLNPSHSCEYVIITNEALKNAPGPYNFQALANSKIAKGMNATIVTVEWIYSNFGGVDNPEKIRNFIRWAYQEWHTQYVLLGGDISVVPYRGLYVQAYAGGDTDYDMESDLYFACLDGSYNSDGDSYWGEPTDGEGGKDVDLRAEVYVGRAPVENATELSNFVRKTLEYDSSQDPYLNKVLLCSEYLGFGGIANYGSSYKEEMRNGSNANGYYTVGIPGDEYTILALHDNATYEWTVNELANIINSGIHIINHLGHANYYAVMRFYYQPPSQDDVELLNNTKYFFAYSQGCIAGAFATTTQDCIAERLVTDDHGAFAVIMNANYGWGVYMSTDGPSQAYDREFFDAVYGENIREIGKANQDSKEDNLYRLQEDCMRWCYYELNLLGDPEIAFKPGTTHNDDVRTKSINEPTNGEIIGTGTYTVNATIENTGLNDQTDFNVNLSIYKLTKNIHFFDDMESGSANWTAVDGNGDGHTWAISTARYNSPTHSFKCTDESTYRANANDSLISKPIDLSGVNHAMLEFWYWVDGQFYSGYRDYGTLYLSDNNGSTWVQVKTYMLYITFGQVWHVPIEAYVNLTNQVRIKFTFVSDGSTNYEGMYIDDVIVYSWDAELVHYDEKTISIESGKQTYVEFAPWSVSQEALYAINVTTKLVGDEYPKNDWQNITVEVNDVVDVGVEAINYPVGRVNTGNHAVNATVKNFGNTDQTGVNVNCSIYQIIPPGAPLLSEDFEGLTPPNFRTGWVVENTNGDTKYWETYNSSTYAHSGYISARYPYHTSNPANDWLFTPGLTLTAGTQYNLSFWYRAYSSSYAESMDVWVGTSQSSTGMTTKLWDNPSITNTVYAQASIIFTVPSDGTYYIGFHCYSGANMYYLYIDDIMVNLAPQYALIFGEDKTVDLDAGEFEYVEFSSYNFATEGYYIINVSTNLAGDEDTTNDYKNITLEVNDIYDAGIKSINYPTGTITTTKSHAVNATAKNYGTVPLSNVPVNCSIYQLGTPVLNEGFESTTFPPTGWTATSYWYRGTSYKHSGGAAAYSSYTSGHKNLTSPLISLGSGNYALEFWLLKYYNPSAGQYFNVYVGPSTSGPWTLLLGIDYSALYGMTNYTWYRFTADLSSYAGSSIAIRFNHYTSTSSGSYIYLDDVMISSKTLVFGEDKTVDLDAGEEKYVEFSPWSVSIEGLYTINVTTKWTSPPDEDTTNDYKEITVEVNDIVDVGTPSINYPTGIKPTGSYAVNASVKNFGNVDQTNVPVNCSIYQLGTPILSEGFETSWPPAGWQVVIVSGTTNWTRSTSYKHSGTYSAYTSYTTGERYMASPLISLGSGSYALEFWLLRYYTAYSGEFVNISVGPSQTGPWTTLLSIDYNMLNSMTSSVWYKFTVDLSSYAGQSISIRFNYIATGGSSIYIDDILVYSMTFLFGEDKTVDLNAGEEKYVEFSPYNFATEDDYLIVVKTNLAGDENTGNDAKTTLLNIWNIDDVGATAINYPAGTIPLPPSIDVNATIKNFGNVQQSNIPVNCSIYKMILGNVLLFQDFEGAAWPPTGWTIVDGGTPGTYPGTDIPATWTDQDPGNRGAKGGCTGKFAIVDSDKFGSGTKYMDEQLITPELNFATETGVILEFDHYYYHYTGSWGRVDIRVGSTYNPWVTIANFTSTTYGHMTYDISSYAAGQSKVWIRWYYNDSGAWAWYWEIDNIKITSKPTYKYVFGDDEIAATLTPLQPDSEEFVEFDTWYITSGSGNYLINVTTLLAGDEFPSNNSTTTIVFLQGVYDAQVKSINRPMPGTYTTGTPFSVNATVKNVGAENLTDVRVNCTIRNSADAIVFTDEQIIVSLITNEEKDVEFAQWVATAEDTYKINVTTIVFGDANPDDDYREISIVINDIPDAGVVSINYPTGTQFTGSYAVNATVANFGNVPIGSFNVNCTIRNSAGDIVFTDEKTVSGLNVGQQAYVIFAPWTVSIEDTYKINVTTMLVGDEDNSNDYNEITLIINDIDDVGVTSINYPPAIAPTGSHAVNATITNFGNVDKTNVPVNCSIYQLDTLLFSEGFEGVTAPYFPSGWKVEDLDGDGYISGSYAYYMWGTYNYTSYAHTGNLSARYNAHSTVPCHDWLFTPGLSLTAGVIYDFTFWYRAYSTTYDQKMSVWIGTTQSSAGMIVKLWDDTNVRNTTYNQAHVVFVVPSDGTYYIGFYSYGPASYGNIYVDDVALYSLNLLFGEDKTVNVNAYSSVYVEFSSYNFATEGDYLIVVKTIMAGDENTGNDAKSMMVEINNIDDVGATAINYPTGIKCTGSYAVNASVKNFGNVPQTNVPVHLSIIQTSTLLSEDFEGLTPPNFRTGWAIENTNGDTKYWHTYNSSTYAHSGYIMARYNYTPSGGGPANDWLFTPGLTLTAGTQYILSFWYRSYSATSNESMDVWIGTSQSSTGMTTKLWDEPNILTTTYKKASITFTVPSDGTYYIGFHCYSPENHWYLYVDDIALSSSTLLFENDKTVPSIPAGGIAYVTFDPYNFATEGNYTMIVETRLPGDENNTNNATQGTVQILDIRDVGVKSIDYPVNVVTLLYEKFEGTFPPAGWTVKENADAGGRWKRNDEWSNRPNYAGGDGYCADADSDRFGSGKTMDTELWTPPISLAGYKSATLTFMASYNDLTTTTPNDYGDVDISTNGGVTWTNLLHWDEDHSAYGPGELVTIDLTPYIGSTIIIRWHYFGQYDWWYEIDNVTVTAETLFEPGSYPIKATVKNYGTTTETFDVTCTIEKLGAGVKLLQDDVESGENGWTHFDGYGDPTYDLWHISTRRYNSAGHSWYCGGESTGQYTNDMFDWLVSPEIDASGAVQLKLKWSHWYDTETNIDVGYVCASPDNYTFSIIKQYSGSSGGWKDEEVDITPYINATTGKINVAFIFISDISVTHEGWYVDDIEITKIGAGGVIYTETVTVYNLPGGDERQITFPPFTAEQNSVYIINVTTLLVGDENPANDAKEATMSTFNEPPVTTCSCFGPLGCNNWYVGPVTIYLSATDPEGVAYTRYRINGGAWQNYTGPVSVSTEGLYTVEYYSVDTLGSTEEIKSCSFGIATSMPETTCIIEGTIGIDEWYTSDVTITLKANAYICGVKATYYRIDGGAWQEYTGPFTYSTEGTHTIEYYSISNACITETPTKMTSFKIDKTSPTAKVIYPNGGEVLGGTITIRWTASDNIGIAGIDLLYSDDAGLTWNIIASNVANTGSYNWNVAGLPYGSNYMVKVVAKDNAGNVAVDTSDGTFTIGMPSPPTVSIVKPRNALYIFDREIIPLPIPVIIGGITVEATASSSIGIAKVEFYIDGALKFTDTSEPYSWLWDERAIGTHEIKVIAYDTTGQKAEDRISVFIINF